MLCPVCIIAPMGLGGAYMSFLNNKFFWIGIVIMILTIHIYYKYKDCKTCKKNNTNNLSK